MKEFTSWNTVFAFLIVFIIGYSSLALPEPYILALKGNQKRELYILLIHLGVLIASIIAFIFFILVKKQSIKGYLNLQRFELKDFLFWVGLLVVANVIIHISFQQYSPARIFDQQIQYTSFMLYSIKLFIFIIGTSVSEEVAYSGFLFRSFEERNKIWLAILISIILRILTHNQGIQMLISVIIAGGIIGLSRWHTKSLYVPILLHILHNLYYSQQFSFIF